ncbi:MAG: hypothetical protein ABF289_06595 [Clostridiales bacterium]
MKPKIGIILPQHYLNPDFLGIEHLKIISSLPLEKIDSLIVDVKDIFGVLYMNIDSKYKNWRINKAYVSYFNEIIKLCAEYDIKKLFGVPCLYDNSITEESYFVVNEYKIVMPGIICPNKNEYKELLRNLFTEIYTKYNNDSFFLPFLRYIPFTKMGITCLCDDCNKKYKKTFGRDLNVENIRNDIIEFKNWTQWKCENIKDFVDDIRSGISEDINFSIELDIEPIKSLNQGIIINDGHDYKILAKSIDEFIIHYYDSSKLPKDIHSKSDLAFNISLLNVADIMSMNKPVSLFFWNIGSYNDFKKKYLLSKKIMPDYAYFLIFSNQTYYFEKLVEEGLF